jgi:hypothetical protein
VPGRLQLHLIDGQLQPGDHALWQVPLYLGDGAPIAACWRCSSMWPTTCACRPPAATPGSGSEVDADLHISGRDIPFQQPAQLLERSSGTVRGEWTFTSLNWIPALFVRKPWLQLDGGGTLKADLRLRNGELIEGSTVDIPCCRSRGRGRRRAPGRHGQRPWRTEGRHPSQAQLAVRLPRFTARPAMPRTCACSTAGIWPWT